MGIVFLIAGLHRVRYRGAIVYAGFIFVAAAAATWVAGRHVWIQHQPPGTVPACGAPLDNLLQMFPLLEVIRKVMTGGGECGIVDWTMLGISMPGWVLIAAVCAGARRHRQQRRLPGARAPLRRSGRRATRPSPRCRPRLGW